MKFTEFLIGRVISFDENAELIFSNLSAAAAFLVTFCAVAKSYKDFHLIDAYLPHWRRLGVD